MTACLLITSRFTQVMLPESSASALPSGIAIRPFDRPKMVAGANADDLLTYIIPVTSFETFMAKALETDHRSAEIVCEEVVDESREIIAFFEEFPSRVVIADIEELTDSPESEKLASIDPEPWLHVLFDVFGGVPLPAALARLRWMEQRCAFGSHAERIFDTLEACTRPLTLSRSTNAEVASSTSIVSRRSRLIAELEREMAGLHSQEELTSKNAALEQALEQAAISQEISDLLIAQLQEDLEKVLSDPTNANSPLPSIWNRGATNESASKSERCKRKRPSHRLKRWALSVFMAPSTRARIQQIRASELFDPDWYVATYADIADSPMTPEHHFLKFGAAEYRDPSPKFSTQRYLWQHPEVDASKENPLLHCLNNAGD